jgi:outer membrane protein assembly factor BamB
MPALTATSECSRSAFGALAIGVLLFACPSFAQQIRFGFEASPAEIELTAPHVDAISGATSARLEQARALAAGGNWDEAVDIYRELSADNTGRVVALDDSRYVSLRTYGNLQLARMPAEGLATYRRRVDALAQPMYQEGLANRDERQLRRVVDEFFCSSWGDDAFFALGELALERGDYAEARSNWDQISPMLRAPNGMPEWLALQDIDLKSKWSEIERRWTAREKPADWLAYPDTNIDLADVRARLVLASIRAGELNRAALELEVFRRLHPDAVGQLGGQKESYVSALERLLASAREWPAVTSQNDWPTFGGSPERGKIAPALAPDLVAVWKEPIQLTPPNNTPDQVIVRTQRARDGVFTQSPPRESQQPLSSYPVIVGGVIMFADGNGIRAVELASGKPSITSNGLLYRNAATEEKTIQIPPMATGGIAHGVPRLTMNVVNHVAYARVGPLATSHPQGRQSAALDRIIGLDLRREGLLTFSSAREDGDWSFEGAPVCDGRRIFVAMRHSDVTPHAYVACFDAATGARRWRTSIGASDTLGATIGGEITHNLLTLVENRIYLNTNLGLVAALDTDTGAIRWISRYERFKGKVNAVGLNGPLHFDRDPAPCVYNEGMLFVAPADTPAIFALDADTGKTIWRQEGLPDSLHLLGVAHSRLIVSGHSLAALDFATGDIKWLWPESTSAGIRGMGRGVVAGNEVFWPTRNEIYAIDIETGAQTRPPINLSPLEGGANLAVAEGRLVVAGYDKLFVLGPPGATTPTAKQSKNDGAALPAARLIGQSKVD